MGTLTLLETVLGTVTSLSFDGQDARDSHATVPRRAGSVLQNPQLPFKNRAWIAGQRIRSSRRRQMRGSGKL
jgi:hypothetical protein